MRHGFPIAGDSRGIRGGSSSHFSPMRDESGYWEVAMKLSGGLPSLSPFLFSPFREPSWLVGTL